MGIRFGAVEGPNLPAQNCRNLLFSDVLCRHYVLCLDHWSGCLWRISKCYGSHSRFDFRTPRPSFPFGGLNFLYCEGQIEESLLHFCICVWVTGNGG